MTREEFEYAIKACGCFIYRGQTYYEESELIKAFEDMGLIEQEPKTEWISVSERLPETDDDVLITADNGEIYIGFIYKYGSKEWYMVGEYHEPIAWMPLPKPYAPQESEDCRKCKKWEDCPCGKEGHESGTSQGYSIGECKDFEPQERSE